MNSTAELLQQEETERTELLNKLLRYLRYLLFKFGTRDKAWAVEATQIISS